MKNKDIRPAHLNGRTPQIREREQKNRNGLCKITITVRKQTAYHLTQMSLMGNGSKDMGRAVDKLVREHQLSMRVGMGGEERKV